MNLSKRPHRNELQALFAACYDNAASHILWADKDGNVFVSPIPNHLSAADFEASQPNMLMRYELWQQGNGYVGENAAEDIKYILRMLESLVKEWKECAVNKPTGIHYINNF